MKRNDLEWAREKEPSYRPGQRQRIPLHVDGALKQRFGTAMPVPPAGVAVPRPPAVGSDNTATFLDCSCSACRAFEAQRYEQLLPIVGRK